MWFLIKCTVKNQHTSPSVLRVQQVVEGEVKEYVVQENVEQAIQQECEVRFSLFHSAPIMNSLLGERLQYLSNKALAGSMITGTYETPLDRGPATRLMLAEIGRLGMKVVKGEGNDIAITPKDFKRFWRKVEKCTSLYM